ncbi:hypothetical protein SARC_13984 [Sphaeroforma arctica JP610]|uniref:FAD dependent oxidoreductase domain-containing protein n=1 Tax=Sphaeroforma arctica JP610 TaxID=667725 RepID=A0A0L0F9Q2_9EUKA|nr:hypothetical protein SARC_13984 [Sphaeroforma arctica JP610]KNC73457.1 hypothetical protein SARC_13984 [Sphaeroforma arctica JP610]|eukprot:XP_014147359.1 hypothetical protein SARC_13984 [Sphaeroforma arctica JP610]
MVNCTGLASRELCNDTHAYPIRGVVIKAKIPESAENVPVYTDDTPGGLTYTIPNGELITLGGVCYVIYVSVYTLRKYVV